MGAPTLHVVGGTSPYLEGWAFAGAWGAKLSNPATLPAGTANGIAQRPQEDYLAVAHASSPFMSCYAWDGAAYGAKVANPATLPAGEARMVAWSPDGGVLIAAHVASPYVSAWPFTPAGGFGAKYANPVSALAWDANGVAFHPSGRWVAVATASSPYIEVYAWDNATGFGAKAANPSTLPASIAADVAWSPDGRFLAVAHSVSPYVSVYEWSGVFGEKLTNPSAALPGDGQAVAFSPSGGHIAIAHATAPFVSVYPFDGGFGNKYSNPAVGIGGTTYANSVAWSPDGEYLAVGHDTSPFVQVYPFVKHQNASGLPTTTLKPALPSPSTLPAGTATGVLFSSAGRAIGSALANSYKLTRPSWELQVQFHRERYALSVLDLEAWSYLRLDETSGTNAKDQFGHISFTYTGGYTLAQGPLLESEEGYSVDLDGSTGYVTGANLPFTGTTAFTVMGLVNHDTFPAVVAVFANNIVIDGSGVQGWEIRSLSTGGIQLNRWLNSAADVCSAPAGTLRQGKTHHVAGTYDGTNLRIYVDGVLVGGPTASSKAIVNAAGALTQLGRSGLAAFYLDGKLDEWAFWSGRALSAANVADLAAKALAFGTDLRPYLEGGIEVRRGLSDDGRPLVGQLTLELDNESGVFTPEELPFVAALHDLGASSHWRLGEGSGTTAFDTMGVVNGTYTGTYALGEPSLLTSGDGRSVDLDGAAGYVPLASSSYNFAGRAAFSIVAVVRPENISGVDRILSREWTDGSGAQGWDLGIDGSGNAYLRRWLDGASDVANGPAALSNNTTYVVAGSYDGQTMRVYVAGLAGTGVASTKSIVAAAQAPAIGRHASSAANYLDGRVQDVAVFDGFALSAEQVAELARKAAAENLYGLMMPYVPVRIRATEGVTGATLPVWRGQVMRYRNRHAAGVAPACTFECESRLGHLQRAHPTTYTPAPIGSFHDDAMAAVLAATQLRVIDHDLDVEYIVELANSHAPRYDVDALSQIAELAEGAGATLPSVFETAGGKVRYRSRYNILGAAGANDRWGDYSAVRPVALDYDARHDDRVGVVEVIDAESFYVTDPGAPVAFVSKLANTGGLAPMLLPGGTYVIEARYEGPWVSGAYSLNPYLCGTVTAPVATTDYLANTLATGLGTNRTANLSVSFSDGGTGFRAVFTNTHATDTIYITKFQVRAQHAIQQGGAVNRLTDPPFRATEPAATIQHNAFWRDAQLGFARVGAALLLIKRYAVPRLLLEFEWDSDSIQGAMLRAELLDLIHFEDREHPLFATAVRDAWRVESLAHSVFPAGNPGGAVNRSVVTLRPAYASAFTNSVVADDFAKANRTNSLGAPAWLTSVDPSWSTSGGTWSIGSSAAFPDAAGARYAVLDTAYGVAYANGRPGTDQMVKCSFENLISTNFVVGIVYRYTDANNLFRAQIDRANRQVQLVRRVGGTDTVVERVPWVPETTAELRIIVQGGRHRVYLNGAALPCIDTFEDRGVLTGSSVGIYGENAHTAPLYKRFAAVGLN